MKGDAIDGIDGIEEIQEKNLGKWLVEVKNVLNRARRAKSAAVADEEDFGDIKS